MSRTLINVLIDEMTHNISGGIYNKMQVDFAYNSNHIEGSQLTHDETRYIFETKTVGIESARVDDIIETVNHFACFRYILETYEQPLSEEYIKHLHRMLKTSTFSSQSDEAVIGDYKKYPNEVGNISTVHPSQVRQYMFKLTDEYNKSNPGLYEIIDFHATFESIHPFFDGNGRVGRLIMLKECLKNDIVPFIIEEKNKRFYYAGLKEWQTKGSKERLVETCLMEQDTFKSILDYFEINYKNEKLTSKEVIAAHRQKSVKPKNKGKSR